MLQLRFGMAKYFLKIKVEKEFVTDTVTVLNIKGLCCAELCIYPKICSMPLVPANVTYLEIESS